MPLIDKSSFGMTIKNLPQLAPFRNRASETLSLYENIRQCIYLSHCSPQIIWLSVGKGVSFQVDLERNKDPVTRWKFCLELVCNGVARHVLRGYYTVRFRPDTSFGYTSRKGFYFSCIFLATRVSQSNWVVTRCSSFWNLSRNAVAHKFQINLPTCNMALRESRSSIMLTGTTDYVVLNT